MGLGPFRLSLGLGLTHGSTTPVGIRGDLGLTLVSATACRVDLESTNTNLIF